MDKTRQWVVLTAVVALAVLAAGWFLLISPQRASASELRDQAATQQAATAKLRSQLAALQAQAKELPAQQAKISAAEAKIPTSADLPPLLRALTAAADGSGVKLLSVVPGPPVPVTAAAASGTAAAAPTATTTTSAAAPASTALSSISLTMSVVGGYYETEQFVSALEELPRALRVATVSVALGDDPLVKKADGAAAPINNGQTLVTSLVGQVFLSTAGAAAPTSTTATTTPAN